MISAYFHIPFCKKKCPYCHFYVLKNQTDLQALLFDSLALEWQQKSALFKDTPLASIYFGGGTPSLFKEAYFEQILSWFSSCKEITIEANPDEVDEKKLSAFFKAGINRISFGVQSLDDTSLQTLGREHNAKKAKQAILLAHKVGFENISIDLMYDLPHQTVTSFKATLEELETLPIQHVSLYNLTLEPNTPFFRKKVPQPHPDLSYQLHCLALDKLESLGLKRYEISAFAKEGKQSIHNLGYWQFRPFLGFGPSAFSYFEGRRFRNIANLRTYAKDLAEGKSPVDFEETLSFPQKEKEELLIRLRVLEGISEKEMPILPEETLKQIEALKLDGFLQKQKGRLSLTKKGTLFYDQIATTLI